VSCHHPACWGPGWRRSIKDYSATKSNNSVYINSSIIHPASVSSVKVDLPRKQDQTLLDELDVVAAVTSARLRVISSGNVEKLLGLFPQVFAKYSLTALDNWKQRLQNCLDAIVGDIMIPKSDRSRVQGRAATAIDTSYMNLNPAPEMFRMPEDDSTADGDTSTRVGEESALMTGDEFCSPPQAMDKGPVQRKRHGIDSLGMDLSLGQTVEVFSHHHVGVLTDPVWVLGEIVKLIQDGSITRYAKV